MSAPPLASSWAEPPEFYIDENLAGRSIRRFIADLGYRVHTPAEVFGRERLEGGLKDEDWLPVIGAQGWVVYSRDHHILSRELELKAYLQARVHMFLLPGTATRQHLLDLVGTNLAHVCAVASARQPSVYWLTPYGLVDLAGRKARRRKRTPS
jgi:hypothetical protein